MNAPSSPATYYLAALAAVFSIAVTVRFIAGSETIIPPRQYSLEALAKTADVSDEITQEPELTETDYDVLDAAFAFASTHEAMLSLGDLQNNRTEPAAWLATTLITPNGEPNTLDMGLMHKMRSSQLNEAVKCSLQRNRAIPPIEDYLPPWIFAPPKPPAPEGSRDFGGPRRPSILEALSILRPGYSVDGNTASVSFSAFFHESNWALPPYCNVCLYATIALRKEAGKWVVIDAHIQHITTSC